MSVCTPLKNYFHIKDNKIQILDSVKCYNYKINKRFSGTYKNLNQFKKNGKNFISYTITCKIPKGKSKKFIKLNETKYYNIDNNFNLEDLLREISFHTKITKKYRSLSTKIRSITLKYIGKNEIQIQIISEDANNNGYKKIGDIIDNGDLDLKFKSVFVTNPVDKQLLKFIKKNKKVKHLDHEFYARFLNPLFFKQNLELWYKKTKHFFIPFFKDLHKLHKLDIYHHDLHFDNIWMKKNKFKFIDFGRSCSVKEALKPINSNSKFDKIRNIEKLKIKNNLKGRMLTELMCPCDIDFEFGRHDIDQEILINCFGRKQNFSEFYYKNIILVYKDFLAEKYTIANTNTKKIA